MYDDPGRGPLECEYLILVVVCFPAPRPSVAATPSHTPLAPSHTHPSLLPHTNPLLHPIPVDSPPASSLPQTPQPSHPPSLPQTPQSSLPALLPPSLPPLLPPSLTSSELPPQRPPGHRHHARAPHPPWPCSASTMTLLRLHYGRVPHPPWLWSFHYGRVPHTPRPCSASIMAVFRLHYGRVPPPPCPCFASTMAV